MLSLARHAARADPLINLLGKDLSNKFLSPYRFLKCAAVTSQGPFVPLAVAHIGCYGLQELVYGRLQRDWIWEPLDAFKIA